MLCFNVNMPDGQAQGYKIKHIYRWKGKHIPRLEITLKEIFDRSLKKMYNYTTIPQ